MSNPNRSPLFYVDDLQKTSSDEYTVELILPENFNYKDKDYVVIGNSELVSDILKIQLTVTGDKKEAPSPVPKTVPVTFNLKEGETGSYFKFQIVWMLPMGSSVGIGDPEGRETVGESVLKGMG
ncbi:hypothetical protein [Zunongwangia sp.]|uniref:hypothetical protein n=1 Tax=Zunongwangia sp. TaxID=1965325 RepID=UPI003AA96686